MKTIAAVFILLTTQVFGQEEMNEEDEFKRPFQMTFVTPIGSNGMEAMKYTNEISINIFAGMNGGVEGAEFGGFVNVIKGDVKGLQAAGFVNTVLHEVRGAQFAGFVNFNRGYTAGIQGAGFANVVVDSGSVSQFSGFFNFVKGSNSGIQGTGFVNTVVGDFKGVQGSGFVNTTIGDLNGVQGTGFINVVTGNTKGAQLAGFVNVTAGDVDGAQIAGFVNRAKTVRGLQLGFLNIADSVASGTSIGFLTIVKNGYHRLEIGASETFYGHVNYKIGLSNFYNIFSLAIKPTPNKFNWAYGYGIGTNRKIGKRGGVNMDAMIYHLSDGALFSYDLNFLTKLNLQLSVRVGKQTQLFGGPSLNLLVTDVVDEFGMPKNPDFIPGTIWEESGSSRYLGIYPGFTAGLRF